MKYTFLFLFFIAPSLLFAQPQVKWQKCLGGTAHDEPGGMIATRDGGYIMAGQTHSSDGDITSNHGNYDLWVVKLDALGAIQWQKTYGGSGDENAGGIIEAHDGGYIIASSTNSSDGDLTGIFHGDSTESDVWVLKIDTLGNIKWQKTYGGSKDDLATSIISGGEGEYIISAETTSNDGDVKGYHGGADIWVFSISESGTLGWQKTFGGTNYDEGSIFQTDGGGFAIIGTTYSNDGDVTGRNKIDTTSGDIWLIKLDDIGGIVWQKTYGGSAYEAGYDAIGTLDHGYVIAGSTSSPNNGDVSGNHQPVYWGDCWIVKTDSIGTIEWQKCLGGSSGDAAYSILQTSDSGYVISGNTTSSDGDVTGHHGPEGGSDCWIFKLSKSGKLIWQEALGGRQTDANIGSGIMQTADNGFLLATVTSSNDGDVSGNHGDSLQSDIWLVKLSEDFSDVNNNSAMTEGGISLYPNPSIGKTTISYDLDKPSEVRIEIFNPLGEQLKSFSYGKEEAGKHEHEFDISGLPSGSYFFRIEMEGKTVLKAMELIK